MQTKKQWINFIGLSMTFIGAFMIALIMPTMKDAIFLNVGIVFIVTGYHLYIILEK